MIKKFSYFKESLEDISPALMSKFINTIRQNFLEFEESDSIEYQFFTMDDWSSIEKNKTVDIWIPCPAVGNFETWLERSLIDYRALSVIKPKTEVNHNLVGLNLYLKLKNTTQIDGKPVLNREGIDQLEDLIVAKNRLADDYPYIYLELGSNHHQFVPATIKIIYN